ncbi:hypothetical protein DKG74_06845 [Zavarzinia aquatilis]|uniref:Uncharacterized protein n=2 Tax=Zavarzinia aquatilis TaxID=2211142 RepID=A0A317EE27_9PROT|nr:hypothetical protein DKG74_06845 [Zavarzinia aquatilis]
MLEAWLVQNEPLAHGWPGRWMLQTVENLSSEHPLTPDLISVLGRIRARARGDRLQYHIPTKFDLQVIERITTLIDPPEGDHRPLPVGAFAENFERWMATLAEGKASIWRDLALLCAEVGDGTAPRKGWLTASQRLVDKIGRIILSERISQLLKETIPDPEHPDRSLDILKGLLWLIPHLDHAPLAGEVGSFAETCFSKITLLGPRSVRLGNAALWTLSEMAGEPRAAAELFRLRTRIQYPSARKIIDKRLADLADKRGHSVENMEDHGLPTFGLDESSALVVPFGGARVELRVHSTGISQQWYSAAGKPVKAPPSEVKLVHGDALSACRQRIKDLEGARQTQVVRLEQSWVENRSWAFETWSKYFLRHPLRRPIVVSLIWSIGDHVVMPDGEGLRDVTGTLRAFDPQARVRLWHPLNGDQQTVLAWRRRILEHGPTQALKQAHREIYVLTEAERATRVYSNRFAAHILRQHQFKALCQARGWTYALMGAWNGGNSPALALPRQSLTAVFHVSMIDEGPRMASGVAHYLSSDRVCFNDAEGGAVALEQIPPVVFSEVLRDADLFVAVTSVANDPNWTDGGPDGRHAGYWRRWAFGELNQSAATRRALMAWLAPRLSIADKLEVADRALIVQGQRQKYAIHLGSGNVQIMQSNRYLCIVADQKAKEIDNIRLPFVGDNILSEIVAKAFLLVDESRIKDPSILHQL